MARAYVRKFDHAEAVQLYRDGASGIEIAARFGVTPKAVYDALDASGVERRSRVTSARAGELRCTTCREWKPDDAFPRSVAAKLCRRGRHQHCRACVTVIRREHRERHKVPCVKCGAARLPRNEKNASARRSHLRDTGLCLSCYRESIRKVAA